MVQELIRGQPLSQYQTELIDIIGLVRVLSWSLGYGNYGSNGILCSLFDKNLVCFYPSYTQNLTQLRLSITSLLPCQSCEANYCGYWVRGFSLKIGVTANIIAKLWAVRYGLNLVWQLVYKYIILEVGLKLVIDWLTIYGCTNTWYFCFSSWLNQFASVWMNCTHLHRVYCKAKRCTNGLAKRRRK